MAIGPTVIVPFALSPADDLPRQMLNCIKPANENGQTDEAERGRAVGRPRSPPTTPSGILSTHIDVKYVL